MVWWNCLQRDPDGIWNHALNVTSKLQWRPQDSEDARPIEHLFRIAVGMEWNQPKGEAVCAVELDQAELLNPTGTETAPMCSQTSDMVLRIWCFP